MMDIEELGTIERCALPGSGSCGKSHFCTVLTNTRSYMIGLFLHISMIHTSNG